jgi:hypothetical protein
VLKQTEDNSQYVFHRNSAGSLAVIVRSTCTQHEIQAAVSQQNTGMLICLQSSSNMSFSVSDAEPTLNIKVDGESAELVLRFQVIADAVVDTMVTSAEVFIESMRGIRIFREGGRDAYHNFMKTGDFPTAAIRADGCCLIIDRRYLSVLHYHSETIFPNGLTIDGNSAQTMLPKGRHLIPISFIVSGIFRPEDFSPLAASPRELLESRLHDDFSSLSVSSQKIVERNLSGIYLLAGRTKLMAGSPRFLTYFGRDTLLSISLFVGKTKEDLVYFGLKSVLDRLSFAGEVAHEETIGEFAHAAGSSSFLSIPEPQLEYTMVDDDFLLPLTLVRCLEKGYGNIVQRLLEGDFKDGRKGEDLIAQNISFCRKQVEKGLVPYHQDIAVGDWRDSLASQGVRYSYELNKGLVPYLEVAVHTLIQHFPRLNHLLTELDSTPSSVSTDYISRFHVSVELKDVKGYFTNWLGAAGFSEPEIIALIQRIPPMVEGKEYYFDALALDRDFMPIGIQHNDVAFALLYGHPSEKEMDSMLIPLETAFPLGLRTEVGLLVSNPCFATQQFIRTGMVRNQYHGLVIWPLMHNILFHGIQHQLQHVDSFGTETAIKLIFRLKAIKTYLLRVMEKTKSFSNSELYTFSVGVNGDSVVPFGKGSGSTTESNPVQLWSNLTFTTLLGEN